MRELVVVVCGSKGGVGKTTSAICLAGALRELQPGENVVVVDGDNITRSAVQWSRLADKPEEGLPFQVVSVNTAGLVKGRRHSIFDLRGGESDLGDFKDIADCFVVPTFPDALSLQGAYKTVATLRDLRVKGAVKVLLVGVPPAREGDGAKARFALEEAGVPCFKGEVPQRKAVRHAAERGTLPRNVRDGGQVADAYLEIAKEIFETVAA